MSIVIKSWAWSKDVGSMYKHVLSHTVNRKIFFVEIFLYSMLCTKNVQFVILVHSNRAGFHT